MIHEVLLWQNCDILAPGRQSQHSEFWSSAAVRLAARDIHEDDLLVVYISRRGDGIAPGDRLVEILSQYRSLVYLMPLEPFEYQAVGRKKGDSGMGMILGFSDASEAALFKLTWC